MAHVVSLVDTGALRTREISGGGDSYALLDAERQPFLAKVEAGTATATDVLNHVMLIDNCGYEVMPSSEGMEWLRHNPDAFVEIVGDVDVFVESVLDLVDRAETQGLDYEQSARPLRYDFFRGFIGSNALMALLSPEWRELFVSELYPRFGSHNDGWISVAVKLGVPRRVIAAAILKRMRGVTVKSGIANDVCGFLEYGIEREGSGCPAPMTLRRLGMNVYGKVYDQYAREPELAFAIIERIIRERTEAIEAGRSYPIAHSFFMEFRIGEEPTAEQKWDASFHGFNAWSVLTAGELVEALAICAEKAPNRTIGSRANMLRRLPVHAVDAIIAEAVGRLTSVRDIPDAEMGRLSVEERKRLAERFVALEFSYESRPTAQFLLRLLTELPHEERRAFYTGTVDRLLAEMDPASLYATWRQLGLTEPSVEDRLRARLDAAGYWVGTIKCGPSPRGGTQWTVTYPNHRITYVEDRGNHRYFPGEGDLVMFRYQGRHLTPTVVAVSFVPVMKDLRS